MNYTQKALGILVGVILLVVLFWIFFYTPASGKLIQLQKEAKDLDKRIAEIKIKKAGLPGVQTKIESARERLERLEVQYPRTIEIVYQAITDAAQKVEFQISKRDTAEKPVEDEETALREYEIKISARCPYQVLGEFLDRITKSPIIISISGLAIVANSGSTSRKGEEGNLRVEMQLNTYLSRTNGL